MPDCALVPRASDSSRGAVEGIEVFVFAARDRDRAHAKCFASIEASDIGTDYTVCEHPEGLTGREHWKATHERAAQAKSDFVVVLEDDVLVNRHILHNCRTWKWRWHSHFGAGWLFRPGGFRGLHDDWYPTAKWHCAQAILYPRALLGSLIGHAWHRMHQPGRPCWDIAMSLAVWDAKRRIRMHGPSLVEHLVNEPSVAGNPQSYPARTSGGTYRADWRRAPGDPHGGGTGG